MPGLELVTELERNRWAAFVRSHPGGNIFQTPEMYDVWKATRSDEPFLLAALDGRQNISGLLQGVIQRDYGGILGGFTARAVVWGGPLAADDDPEVFDLLLGAFDGWIKKRAIFSQFRNLRPPAGEKALFQKWGFRADDHLDILVDLTPSEDELWKGVHSKRRNEIRRARKEGTTVRELTTPEEIARSYRILKAVYRRARVPLHDRSLFEAAFRILGPRNMVRFFGALNRGRVIGTMVVLCYKDRLYDWYAGSYREFYRQYPNDLLPWHIFLWGKEKGFTVFDFGGAGKPGKPYGVREYKKKFGGRSLNFGRYEKTHKPLLMGAGKWGLKWWRRLRGLGRRQKT